MHASFPHAASGLELEKRGIQFKWLLRLRWLSVAGQILVIFFFATFYDYVLPLGLLATCIILVAATNALAHFADGNAPTRPGAWILALIAVDTAILTLMLYHTGGAHNPFSSLYLLHITLAAILLPSWGPWVILGLSSMGFSLLFSSPHSLIRTSGPTCCTDLDAHLKGMLMGMIIAGIGISYFVSRVSESLKRHRRELAEMSAVASRNQRFASLATLSAGLAHELATPLGTIALVSADIEQHVCEVCHNQECMADAKLIREEVARCRTVLDRVANEITGAGQPGIHPLRVDRIPQLMKSFLAESCFVRVQFEGMDARRTLKVSETALLQALAVLLKNACEASPPDRGVVLRFEQTPDEAVLAVEDRGTGMSTEVAERAGEPFFTTKEPGNGMGLGLFVVRTFVEGMKGKMIIDSREGEGTTVRLSFPAILSANHSTVTANEIQAVAN